MNKAIGEQERRPAWLQNCWIPSGLLMVSPPAAFGERGPSFSFGFAKYFVSGDEVVAARRVQTAQHSTNKPGEYKQPRTSPSASPCSVAQATLAMGYSSQAVRNTGQGECCRALPVTLTQLDSLCSGGEGNFLDAVLSGTSGLYQRNEILLAESGAKPVFGRRRRWAESPLRVHPQSAS